MNLLYVIHSYTHSCHTFSYSLMSYHGRSGQTYPFHSIHTHLILILTNLILTHLILTITYRHCFFNLKITFIYSTLSPIYTFVTLRIQEMQTTHTYINIIFVILFIFIFVKNFFLSIFYLI
jgi:hypothetical protein